VREKDKNSLMEMRGKRLFKMRSRVTTQGIIGLYARSSVSWSVGLSVCLKNVKFSPKYNRYLLRNEGLKRLSITIKYLLKFYNLHVQIYLNQCDHMSENASMADL